MARGRAPRRVLRARPERVGLGCGEPARDRGRGRRRRAERRAVRPDRRAGATRDRAAPTRRGVMDVAVVGGGIVGAAAAAFLAEAGAEVTLAEQAEIGAGASGRNSGAVQHPFDPALVALHEETVALYRELEAPGTNAFPLDRPPDGLIGLAPDREPLEIFAADVWRELPELDPQLLSPAELAELEPSIAPGVHGCRTETAWAVPPAAATHALADRAREAGARFASWPESFELEAAVTLVTAGPWTPSVADPT